MFLFLLLLAGSPAPVPNGTTTDQAWSVLQNGVENKSAQTRAKAVHALGLLPGNRKAEQWAEKALGDPNADVRTEAATALGQMADQAARPKLRETLNDNEAKVVVAAANALYVLKDPAAYEVFYALLTGERKGSDGLVQSQLNILRDRKALEKLAFETGIGFVPFGSMSYEAWKTVSHDDTTPIKVAAEEKLATDPDPKTGEALGHACSDKKWEVRAGAAEAIARRGDPRLLPSVTPLLLDENDTVRSEAAATVLHLSARPGGRHRSGRK